MPVQPDADAVPEVAREMVCASANVTPLPIATTVSVALSPWAISSAFADTVTGPVSSFSAVTGLEYAVPTA